MRMSPGARCLTGALLAVLACTSVAVPPAAGDTSDTCSDRPPVVVLHDIAVGTESVAPLTQDLRAHGRCVTVLSYGAPQLVSGTPLEAPSALGGLASLGAATTEVGAPLARVAGGSPTGRIDLVGVGAGSLVALRYLHTAAHPVRVRTLVAIGALWRGTNLVGLGTLEQAR